MLKNKSFQKNTLKSHNYLENEPKAFAKNSRDSKFFSFIPKSKILKSALAFSAVFSLGLGLLGLSSINTLAADANVTIDICRQVSSSDTFLEARVFIKSTSGDYILGSASVDIGFNSEALENPTKIKKDGKDITEFDNDKNPDYNDYRLDLLDNGFSAEIINPSNTPDQTTTKGETVNNTNKLYAAVSFKVKDANKNHGITFTPNKGFAAIINMNTKELISSPNFQTIADKPIKDIGICGASELTLADLTNTNLSCNPAQVNSTTTCNFDLPNLKTWPSGGVKLSIGDATGFGECNLNGNTANCAEVPTGSKSGEQSIQASVKGGDKGDTAKKVQISSEPIQNTTVSMSAIAASTNCTQNKSVNIPDTVDCNFGLNGVKNPVLPSSGIFAMIKDDSHKNGSKIQCQLVENTINCPKIPTSGLNPGNAKVMLGIGQNMGESAEKGELKLVLNFDVSVEATPNKVNVGQNIGFTGKMLQNATAGRTCTFTITTPAGKQTKINAQTNTQGVCTININSQGKISFNESLNDQLGQNSELKIFSFIQPISVTAQNLVSGDTMGLTSQIGSGKIDLTIDNKSATNTWQVITTTPTTRSGGQNQDLSIVAFATLSALVMIGIAFFIRKRFHNLGDKNISLS